MIHATEINLLACLYGFLSVLVTCFIILTSKKWHLKYSSDSNVGPQKIHKDLVPRIGGFSLLAGIVTAILFEIPFAAGFLIGGLPVFLTGITEDISNKIPPLFKTVKPTSMALQFCLSATDPASVDTPRPGK